MGKCGCPIIILDVLLIIEKWKEYLSQMHCGDMMIQKMKYFYQNNSYEITINGFQVRKIHEIRTLIFGLRYGRPSSPSSPSWMFTKLSTLRNPNIWGKRVLKNEDSWSNLLHRKIWNNIRISFFWISDIVHLIILLRDMRHFSDLYSGISSFQYQIVLVW